MKKNGEDGFAIAIEDYRGVKPNQWDDNRDLVIKVRGDYFFIDLADWCYFEQTRIYNSGRRGYLSAKFGGGDRSYFHRFVMDNPKGMVVDHINHNVRDNRRSNLRTVFSSQNNSNSRRFNKEGYRGIREKKGAYEAHITFQRKCIYGGRYKTPDEAAAGYDKLALKYFGEACITNFPKSNYDIPETPIAEEILEPASFKWGGEKCEYVGCKKRKTNRSDTFCLTHLKLEENKDQRKSLGLKVNNQRVDNRTELCVFLGCDKKTFAQNLCSSHYRLKRIQQGYKKAPKKKYPCSVDGCETMADKIKERLCRKHWNEKHGIVNKRTGRPKAKRVSCSVCGEEATANTGLCKKHYTEQWRKSRA